MRSLAQRARLQIHIAYLGSWTLVSSYPLDLNQLSSTPNPYLNLRTNWTRPGHPGYRQLSVTRRDPYCRPRIISGSLHSRCRQNPCMLFCQICVSIAFLYMFRSKNPTGPLRVCQTHESAIYSWFLCRVHERLSRTRQSIFPQEFSPQE